MPNILITTPDLNTSTPVGINGSVRHVPHNKPTQVSDEELEVLNRADLGTAKLQVLPEEVDADPAGDDSHVDPKTGTESDQGPATPAETSESGNTLLGDAANPQGAETGAGNVDTDHSKESGQQSGKDSSKEFDADKFLDRSIDAMSEDFDEVDAGQIDKLIAAEKKRETPRSTLLDKLEAKKTALASA